MYMIILIGEMTQLGTADSIVSTLEPGKDRKPSRHFESEVWLSGSGPGSKLAGFCSRLENSSSINEVLFSIKEQKIGSESGCPARRKATEQPCGAPVDLIRLPNTDAPTGFGFHRLVRMSGARRPAPMRVNRTGIGISLAPWALPRVLPASRRSAPPGRRGPTPCWRGYRGW